MHSKSTQAVTVRLDREFVPRVKAAAAAQGEDLRVFVERVLKAEVERVEAAEG